MDIRKLVEEEMRKVLKEDEAAPKGVVFKNPKNLPTCKAENEIPRGSIGLVCKNKKNGSGLTKFPAEGFVWADSENEDSLDVKTSDPAIIKKYTYIQQVRIAQQIENAISKIKSIPTSKIKRVGDIQGAVELLRKYFPLVGSKIPFPSKQNYRDLTTRLQAILTVILKNPDTVKKAYEQAQSEIAKEKETATQPVTATTAQPATSAAEDQLAAQLTASAATAQEIKSGLGSRQEPIKFDELEAMSPKNKAGKIVYFSKNNAVYPAKFNVDGTSYTLLGGKFPNVQQESKLIRKMIIQEVRKALRK